MEINEQLVTGRKFRKLVDEVNKLWQRISFWTKACDVEFDDGQTAETKLGAIQGVTDSLTSTASNIAASAAAVKALNDKVTELNSNILNIFEVSNGTDMKVLLPNDYQNLTTANFFVSPLSHITQYFVSNLNILNPSTRISFEPGTFSYNPTTGIFSMTAGSVVLYQPDEKQRVYGSYPKAICVYPLS